MLPPPANPLPHEVARRASKSRAREPAARCTLLWRQHGSKTVQYDDVYVFTARGIPRPTTAQRLGGLGFYFGFTLFEHVKFKHWFCSYFPSGQPYPGLSKRGNRVSFLHRSRRPVAGWCRLFRPVTLGESRCFCILPYPRPAFPPLPLCNGITFFVSCFGKSSLRPSIVLAKVVDVKALAVALTICRISQ